MTINKPTIWYHPEENELGFYIVSFQWGFFFFFTSATAGFAMMSISLTNSFEFYLNRTKMHMLQGGFITYPERYDHIMGII